MSRNFMPCILVLHFHVLQFHALQMPRKLVRQFHVLQFLALHIGLSISCLCNFMSCNFDGPSFSCPAFSVNPLEGTVLYHVMEHSSFTVSLIVADVCLYVLKQIHQYRRLARAQAFHMSDDERKRRRLQKMVTAYHQFYCQHSLVRCFFQFVL